MTTRENPSFEPCDQIVDETIVLRDTIGKTSRMGIFPRVQHFLYGGGGQDIP